MNNLSVLVDIYVSNVNISVTRLVQKNRYLLILNRLVIPIINSVRLIDISSSSFNKGENNGDILIKGSKSYNYFTIIR